MNPTLSVSATAPHPRVPRFGFPSLHSRLKFSEKRPLPQCKETFEAYQSHALLALKTIFDEQQPCTGYGKDKLQKELSKTKAALQRTQKTFKALSTGSA